MRPNRSRAASTDAPRHGRITEVSRDKGCGNPEGFDLGRGLGAALFIAAGEQNARCARARRLERSCSAETLGSPRYQQDLVVDPDLHPVLLVRGAGAQSALWLRPKRRRGQGMTKNRFADTALSAPAYATSAMCFGRSPR